MVELAEVLYQQECAETPVVLAELPDAFFQYFEVECK